MHFQYLLIFLYIIWYPLYKGRHFIFLFPSWISYSTISVHHLILVNMQIADTGSKDLAFQWESLLPTDNIKDWIFQSTPYSGSINSYALFGVYTIAYTGGTTYAGEANEDFRYQRPALYRLESYNKYCSSI